MSKKLARFLLDYGDSLHDPEVKKNLAKMFDLEYGPKQEKPEEDEDEEEEEE